MASVRGLTRHALQRSSKQSFGLGVRSKSTYAVALDIDGVLYRGKQVIPAANEVLNFLKQNNRPWILLTNGGGLTEEKKATAISKTIGVEIPAAHLVQSHTPMKQLAEKYRDKLVLLVGKDHVREIAHQYGFRNYITTEEYHSLYPVSFPDQIAGPPTKDTPTNALTQGVAAIFVFMDPTYWHRDIQLCTDVLRTYNGFCGEGTKGFTKLGTKQSVPLYTSGVDLEYVTEWHSPRMGAGVFGLLLAHSFELLHHRALDYTCYGKPNIPTYEYAEKVLQQQAKAMGYDKIDRIFGVGDNPKSDIAGANAAGWSSVLVRTGMFSSQAANDSEFPAEKVCDHVGGALEYIKSVCK